MSEINYQALREAAERAIPAMERLLTLPADDDLLSEKELKDSDVDIDAINNFKLLTGPETVLALLDERERNQQYIKRRDQENEDIALTVGKLRVELEAAEKRNAELQSENAYIRNRFKELDLLIGKTFWSCRLRLSNGRQLATLRADWHGFITHCLAPANCRTNLRKMLRPTLIANMHRLTKSLWSFTSGFGNKVNPSAPLAFASKESDMATLQELIDLTPEQEKRGIAL